MSDNKSVFVKIFPLEDWKPIEAELAQLRAMKSALDKLYAIKNSIDINPSGGDEVPERTFITIYDIDYLSHEIVQEDGDTLTEAIEKALAEYERVKRDAADS